MEMGCCTLHRLQLHIISSSSGLLACGLVLSLSCSQAPARNSSRSALQALAHRPGCGRRRSRRPPQSGRLRGEAMRRMNSVSQRDVQCCLDLAWYSWSHKLHDARRTKPVHLHETVKQ